MIEVLTEPLSFAFMERALVAAVVISIVCGLLSCWLVLIGWSLMGDAVSHAVLPGVVLAYIGGLPFAFGAAVFAFLAVGLIGLINGTSRVKEDAAMGVVFTTLFAFGLVLISVTPSTTDLNHIIFGNLLGISASDLWQIVGLCAAIVAVIAIKHRDLTLYSFDPVHAHAIGLSPRWIGAILLSLLALTTVVALQAVGVILVVAMLIIPGATAYSLTDRLSIMLLLSPAVATISAVVGVYVSYYADTAPGGTIVLAQGAGFTLAYLFAPRHGLITRSLARRHVSRV